MNHLHRSIAWITWKLSRRPEMEYEEAYDFYYLITDSRWRAAWLAWRQDWVL